MAKAYSKDLRERVIWHREKGVKPEEIAKILGISLASCYRWIKSERERGSIDPIEQKRPGHSNRVLAREEEEFRKLVEENVGLNAEELAKKWKRSISHSTFLRYLRKYGFTCKKNNIFMKNGMKQSVFYSMSK